MVFQNRDCWLRYTRSNSLFVFVWLYSRAVSTIFFSSPLLERPFFHVVRTWRHVEVIIEVSFTDPFMHSLVPRPHPQGEGLVTSSWYLGLHKKFIAYCMHSCELITNLHAKKVLCHRVEVVKNFLCCNHRLCFLQLDWREQSSSPKSNQLNEARGIGWRSPDPFFLVRGRGLGTRPAGIILIVEFVSCLTLLLLAGKWRKTL